MTKAVSFMDIFVHPVECSDGTTVEINKIIIPQIQRDYAQGRKNSEVNRVRTRFLDALYEAITGDPIKLDFIYGDVCNGGTLIPLDGQQRLTTLFLLHWYAAKKECVADSNYAFLQKFSYATRPSARDFCAELVKFNPSFEGKLSEEIEDSAWFPLGWKKDPTVDCMLVMLDAIDEKFRDVDFIWQKLMGGKITFYLMSIKEMGQTDEIYIRMNSRGKPLTTFEHFKAELEYYLKAVLPEDDYKRIVDKIDRDWTDMLWEYRVDNKIDSAYLNYFRFICNILCYKSGGSTLEDTNDEFELIKEYFSSENKNVLDNIKFLEDSFDAWCIGRGEIEKFFSTFISNTHEAGKKIYSGELDIFNDCLKNYIDYSDNGGNRRSRSFSLAKIVTLYAFLTYRINKNSVSEAEFTRRIRVMLNLVVNSRNELNENDNTDARNRMPAIIKFTENYIINGNFDLSLTALNQNQLDEETEKEAWLKTNMSRAEELYELEDNELLDGQIAVVGLDNPDNFKKFGALFSCDLDKVNCAMTVTGNYMQLENTWRYRMGAINKYVWKTLFHRSKNVSYFDETKKVLAKLLSSYADFNDGVLDSISENYIKDCESKKEYDWRYYFIKYPEFRPDSHGKYWWSNFNGAPYEFYVLQTKTNISSNTYQPFLQTVRQVDRNDFGKSILLADGSRVRCFNDRFEIRIEEGEGDDLKVTVKDTVKVLQTAEGIDTENRIEKLKKHIENL